MIHCLFDKRKIHVSNFSPFHMEAISTQIARQAALLPLEIVEIDPTPHYSFFKQILESKHRVASLALSDAADFGAAIVENAKINLAKPHRNLWDLKEAFKGIPAILVGAGPSLEDNGHLIPENALILAGGHALKKVKPHIGCLIDKNPLEFTHAGFPMCIQPRAYPVDGEILIAPDSHFPLMGEIFDGGWTVGNFMAAIAVHFGCDPIVCVGMDYCTREGKKYAFEETQAKTQDDWLASVEWLKNLEKKHPEITFLNASNGLEYFTSCKLEDLKFEKQVIDVQKAISKASLCTTEFDEKNMLEPLWHIWEPVFARAGNFTEDQMQMHKELFFQQVLGEYANILA